MMYHLGFVYTCRECHRFSYRLKVGSMQYHDADNVKKIKGGTVTLIVRVNKKAFQ